jgi:hypothetical protein
LQPRANGPERVSNTARRKLKAFWPLALLVKAGQRVFGQVNYGANLRFAENGVIRKVGWDQRDFGALARHKFLMHICADVRDA